MTRTPAPPSLTSLFVNFLIVGLVGFGGVMPWARRMIVEQRRWLTATEFTDMLGLCQFLPGGNIMNLTIAFGARFHGIPGSLVCFVGLMAAPVTGVILLGAIYDRFSELPWVRHGFAGLAAGAAALVLANALKIASPLRTRPLGIGVAVVSFAAIALLRLPLLVALPVLVVLSTLVQWRSGT
jgi:chromate transporter